MSIVDCSTCGARINYFKFYLYERSYFRKCVGEEFALRGNSCRKVFYCPVVIQKLLWHQTKVFTYEMTGENRNFLLNFSDFYEVLKRNFISGRKYSGCRERLCPTPPSGGHLYYCYEKASQTKYRSAMIFNF